MSDVEIYACRETQLSLCPMADPCFGHFGFWHLISGGGANYRHFLRISSFNVGPSELSSYHPTTSVPDTA
eukprot:1983537-Rhodomonas_salina.1